VPLDFTVFFSSSVVGGLIAGFIALRTLERNIQIENITQERAKWREKIRIKSVEVHQASMAYNKDKLSQLRLEFSLNLNPFEIEDSSILSVIADLQDSKDRGTKLAEFSDRVALLLKHDWERAKYEAKHFNCHLCPPERITYAKHKATIGQIS